MRSVILTALCSVGVTAGAILGLQADRPTPIIIAPSSGIEGFQVAPFCNDPLTKVVALPAPDVGVTWQLTRLQDGKFETVVVPGSFLSGTHYYDSTIGQQSEPASVDDAAKACIEKKGKR